MSNMLVGRLLLASAALALAACGGGGGGSGVASTPPPTQPPPTQPPPPPVTVSPAIFPGVITNTDFAALGLEATGRNTPASALAQTGFSVRYDGATKNYLIDLPSIPAESVFDFFGEDSRNWQGFLVGQDPYVDVFKPVSTNPEIQLAYTSFAVANGYYTTPFGFVAFGMATPTGGVPITGTATFDAYARGATLNSFAYIDGDATLQFDFGAGTLSGHFEPVHDLNGVVTPLGSYNFVNTVFGVGSTTFSGALSHSGINTLGAFDGRFTGPAAQELMARWTAPYLVPGTQQSAEMFGIWVGKRP